MTQQKDHALVPLAVTEDILRASAGEKKREWLTPWKPSEFVNFIPARDYLLMGDCHLTRGGLTVLGGFAGVGKSRAALALAIAGACGVPWLGHPVHARFRTLIIQCENGPFRLKTELTEALASVPGQNLDEWVRITPPPAYGLAFREAGFRVALQQVIEDFQPGLIVIDPWNRTAEGDKQTDYREALDAVMSCMPEDHAQRPALVVIHHMRKKSSDSTRKQGRDLLHELAGSYQIGSAARCVFILEPATADTTDPRLVLTCCKNNDGKEGSPTAWIRRNGLFDPIEDFDMDAFLNSEDGLKKQRGVPFGAIAQALRGMCGETKYQVVGRLVNAGVCSRSTAYGLVAEYPDQIVEDSCGKYYWRDEDAA